jgi:hypothetical protein
MSADTNNSAPPTAEKHADAERAAAARAYLLSERRSESEQLVQDALDLRADLLAAEAEAKRLRKLFDAACARLVPMRGELDQVAA